MSVLTIDRPPQYLRETFSPLVIPPGTKYDPPKYEHERLERLGRHVIIGASSGTLRDILGGRHGLSPKDEYIFVLPPEVFKDKRFFADLEFPLYFHAFVKQGLARGEGLSVVGTPHQLECMKNYLREALLGSDFSDMRNTEGLSEERITFFKNIAHHLSIKDAQGNILPIEKFINGVPFSEYGNAAIQISGDVAGEIRLQAKKDRISGKVVSFDITESPIGGVSRSTSLSAVCHHPEPYKVALSTGSIQDIERYRFGLSTTCLGNSNGFDPVGYSTCFVIWVNGTGILIDPSVEGVRALKGAGYGSEDIKYVVLTHNHQDHDSGLIEWVLSGGRHNIIAARTVFQGFLNKASEIQALSPSLQDTHPSRWANWIEIDPDGGPLEIRTISGQSALLESWWNIHPIPTIGLAVHCGGESIAISGDTLWDMKFIDDLAAKGVISTKEAHEQKFRLFTPDGIPKHGLVLFEAGMPPIHTKAEDLAAFIPDEHKAAVNIYHLPGDKVDENLGLKRAELFHTKSVLDSTLDDLVRHFAGVLLAQNPHFQGKDEGFVRDQFMNVAEYKVYQPGEKLIVQGTKIKAANNGPVQDIAVTEDANGDRGEIYFILKGKAAVVVDGKEHAEVGPGSSVGEWGALLGEDRSADIVAKDTLEVFSIHPTQFAKIFDDESLRKRLETQRQMMEVVSLFSRKTTDEVYSTLGSFMLHLLSGSAAPELVEFKQGEQIVKRGEVGDKVYLVKSGQAKVVDVHGDTLAVKERGDLIGEIAVLRGGVRTADVIVTGTDPLVAIEFPKEAFEAILTQYPYIKNNLDREVDQDLRELVEAYLRSPLRNVIPDVAVFRLLLTHMVRESDSQSRFTRNRAESLLSMMNKAIIEFTDANPTLANELCGLGFKDVRTLNTNNFGNSTAMLTTTNNTVKDHSIELGFMINKFHEDGAGERPVSYYKQIADEAYRTLKSNAVLYLVTGDSAYPLLDQFDTARFAVTTLVNGMYCIRSKYSDIPTN